VDSPSYTLNHEEVEKALEEGIVFRENLAPERIEVDEYGHACAVKFSRSGRGISRSTTHAPCTRPVRTRLPTGAGARSRCVTAATMRA